MAEDLQMYQADISNIEKAKSGSGITDITKLDMISEYLNLNYSSWSKKNLSNHIITYFKKFFRFHLKSEARV